MASANYSRKIVCLANSRKNSGRCVAGKIFDGDEKGTWVRPVSSRNSAELAESDRRYQNGSYAEVADVISIPMKSFSAHPYQNENHLIDDGFYWVKNRDVNWDELKEFLDDVEGPLWENDSSSYNGLHDRVDEDRAAQAVSTFGNSLCLIEVDDLEVVVRIEGAQWNNAKRHVRGGFSYDGIQYRMMITDPALETEFLGQDDGEYHVGPAMLCISLGNVYNGHAYKLIATVFRP